MNRIRSAKRTIIAPEMRLIHNICHGVMRSRSRLTPPHKIPHHSADPAKMPTTITKLEAGVRAAVFDPLKPAKMLKKASIVIGFVIVRAKIER